MKTDFSCNELNISDEFEFDSKVESPLYDFTLNWITK
jgi:hypothetical protein